MRVQRSEAPFGRRPADTRHGRNAALARLASAARIVECGYAATTFVQDDRGSRRASDSWHRCDVTIWKRRGAARRVSSVGCWQLARSWKRPRYG